MKAILNEVLEEGDESQREQAKKLLDQIRFIDKFFQYC